MTMLRFALLSGVILSLSGAAQAADVSAPMTGWTGFYAGVGVGGGYSFSNTNVSGGGSYYDYAYDGGDFNNALSKHVTGIFNCNTLYCEGSTGAGASAKGDQGQAGFLGRAEVGADYQFDRFVAGLNASFTLGDREMTSKGSGGGGGSYSENDGTPVNGSGSGGVKSTVDVGDSWSIGARFGYLVTDSTLLFGGVGYTQGDTSIKSKFSGGSAAIIDKDSNIVGAYDISASKEDWLGGYYLGAGMETMVMDHVSLKLEYRYADYGSIKANASDADEACTNNVGCRGYDTGVKSKADVTDHSLMATVSYRL